MNDIRQHIDTILSTCRSIAVIGFSRDPSKAARQVPLYMKEQGYTLYPVNPRASSIAGLPAYPDLDAIPHPVDLVLIFRPSNEVRPFVDAAIRRARKRGDIKAIWLQEGITDPESARRVTAAGLLYVEDR